MPMPNPRITHIDANAISHTWSYMGSHFDTNAISQTWSYMGSCISKPIA
ncbi:hypothetical protein F383_28269 [Gossypium arboreum]|uniref:Uncharacterized protein n=1 Tax=Gossypium arboreum TaxID=29729 RepID=A0A0B0MSN4_GOSAR|nr:hypothetical protein F383_28269 [Gossypium arboreum]